MSQPQPAKCSLALLKGRPARAQTRVFQAQTLRSAPGSQVRMATFSQHHVDGLDLALTPLQAMMRIFPGVKDEPLR